MAPEIIGSPLEQGDNDPVEVRKYENIMVGGAPIGYPISPVYSDGEPPAHLWQYFSAGMIIESANTCAQILYGPIFEFYGGTGQFQGPLGSPMTDVTQLPDGTFYAAFENGVLWLDSTGTVHTLAPLAPGLVKSFSGIDPSANGITTFAQQKLQGIVNNAIQTNQNLKDNVQNIAVTITSLSTGSGGCTGAGFNSAGRSLLRSHIFGVHLDFSLDGCAAIIGSAEADLHIEIRLNVSPPNISGFLVSYNIDNVSSPWFGAADGEIRSGLTNALNGYYGTDLIGQSLQLPKGFSVLAVIVQATGDVDVYIEPTVCGATMMLRLAGVPDQQLTLGRIRQLRERLTHTSDGKALIEVAEAMSPVLLVAILTESDAPHLSASVAGLLGSAFQDDDDVAMRFNELAEPASRLHRLLSLWEQQGSPEVTDHLVARAVRFIREKVTGKLSFGEVMHSLDEMLAEETRRLGSK